MLVQRNTAKQGDVGLADSMAFFAAKGYTVCLPISDSQAYDLLVELNGVVSKVQVKTTRHITKHGNHYLINVGNKEYPFDNTQVDFLYFLTNENERYLVPAEVVTNKYKLRLNKKFLPYLQNFELKLGEYSSTKKQGDVGTCAAARYFSMKGFNVSIPLTDTQPHDLLINRDRYTGRIQAKTTSTGAVGLSQYDGLCARHFEFLFVLTREGKQYVIPSRFLTGLKNLTLNSSFDSFLV